MSDRASQFLEGDLLERYLMGSTSPMESQEVEYFIEKFPQVSTAYEELQENLENYAASFAVKAPDDLKSKILGQTKTKPERAMPLMAITACMVAILFCIVAFMIHKQNQELLKDRQFTSNLLENLSDDIVSNRQMLQSVEKQFMILNSAATQKYILTGNNKARRLEAVAYVNQLEKKSYVHVANLPELPDEQVYQMWAQVDGKLIPLDILKLTKDNLVEIPYEERMASLNVTIEPKGGSNTATMSNEVAAVIFSRDSKISQNQ